MNSNNTEDLIVRYLDESISRLEFGELQSILRSDGAALALYLEHLTNHSLLQEFYPTTEVIAPIRHLKPAARPIKPRVLSAPKRVSWGPWAAAACGILVAGALAYHGMRAPPAVASLSFRDESIWYYETAELARDSTNRGTLETNRLLHLEEGSLRAQLASGVVAVVQGPAVLRLESDKILHLKSGRGWFSVPRPARGFEVVTPLRRITDLGTQFGVLEAADSGTTEVHVFKGHLVVDSDQGAAPRKIKAGHALVYDATGDVRAIEIGPKKFIEKLPTQTEVVFTDDFELENVPDGVAIEFPPPTGWTRIGKHVVGLFNPDDKRVWYKNPRMLDSEPTQGCIGAMKGPTMAYFYMADPGDGMTREVGKIETNSIYSLSFAIGERPEELRFGGYTASLMSGQTELATTRSDSSPGGPETVELVNLCWDSNQLPAGIHPGDPLSIRFTVNNKHYLDIDNVRLVRVLKP